MPRGNYLIMWLLRQMFRLTFQRGSQCDNFLIISFTSSSILSFSHVRIPEGRIDTSLFWVVSSPSTPPEDYPASRFISDPFGGAKLRSGSTLSVRLNSRRRQAPAFILGSRRVDFKNSSGPFRFWESLKFLVKAPIHGGQLSTFDNVMKATFEDTYEILR